MIIKFPKIKHLQLQGFWIFWALRNDWSFHIIQLLEVSYYLGLYVNSILQINCLQFTTEQKISLYFFPHITDFFTLHLTPINQSVYSLTSYMCYVMAWNIFNNLQSISREKNYTVNTSPKHITLNFM